MIDIFIPSCKDNIDGMLDEIRRNTQSKYRLIRRCRPDSAAVNRNCCLRLMKNHVGIMLDDDITGFYPGWEEQLVAPLDDHSVIMVSARLLNLDGTFGDTCSRCLLSTPERIPIKPGPYSILPTAAIAFRNFGILFDEGYVGSGFEDSDWCFEHHKQYPDGVFIQSNECRLIHLNEMKNQKGFNWAANKERFESKWM